MTWKFKRLVWIAGMLLLAANAPCRADSRLRSDWSAPVEGLRGRLILVGRESSPYRFLLELQNVSTSPAPLTLDFDPAVALKIATVDGSGHREPFLLNCYSADMATSGPVRLALPKHGLVRLLLANRGSSYVRMGAPPNDPGYLSYVVEGMFGRTFAPPSAQKDLAFACELRVPATAEDKASSGWSGNLDLPEFRITRAMYDIQPAADQTTETLERRILEHAREPKIAGQALMDLGSVYSRIDEKEKAIQVYERAASEYGDEGFVQQGGDIISFYGPGGIRSTGRYRTALTKNELGDRDGALAILDDLAATSGSQRRRDARVEALLIRQSNLKLTARISIPKDIYLEGEKIVASVSIRNTNSAPAIFHASVMNAASTLHTPPLAPLKGGMEIDLAPGEEYREDFSINDLQTTRGMRNEGLFGCFMEGIPFESDLISMHGQVLAGATLLKLELLHP